MDKGERLPKEEDRKYRRIFGGLAWPGQRPGFVVMVGESRELDYSVSSRTYHVLDEIESDDLFSLTKRSVEFDFYYRPEVWLGNTKNAAGLEVIHEVNKELCTMEMEAQGWRRFNLNTAPFLNAPNSFEYLYTTIKKVLSTDQKLLYLGEKTKIKNYLLEPRPNEISCIKSGDYPAIEALGYAVLGLIQTQAYYKKTLQTVAISDD